MKRFYIKTNGNDDNAYREAIHFACEYVESELDEYEIILYARTKSNVGWLTRLFDQDTMKSLFRGTNFSDCGAKLKIETFKTLNKYHTKPKLFVIAMGMKNSELMPLEDINGVGAVLGIPWLIDDLDIWIKSFNPVEIRGEKNIDGFEELECIVKQALADLSEDINISTGITHPSDNNYAKTIIRTFKKYNIIPNPDSVESYLISHHNWRASHSKEFCEILRKSQAGKTFKGGDKTGLKNYYKYWKSNCE